ncbi:MAG: hypothetical protein LQ352_007556 [Teloschistes flavicans]|nr:MAG: hypothetical protein LQ352_007556 [Teloschistes flavicans]
MTNFRQDFNSAWTGAVPYTTSGPDNTVGSTRSYHASTVEGAYNLTEQLTKRSISSDGAYTASFEQLKSTVPIEFHGKNGSFDGYWITYRTRYVFEYETAIISNVYSCATGHPQEKRMEQRDQSTHSAGQGTRTEHQTAEYSAMESGADSLQQVVADDVGMR